MMSNLQTYINEVRDALIGAGLNVFGFIPARPDPPVVIFEAGDPFIEWREGNTWGEHWMKLYIYAIPGMSDNDVVVENAYTMLETVQDTVDNDMEYWVVEEISAPFDQTINGESYLWVRITITKKVNI